MTAATKPKYNKHEIYEILQGYHWIKKEVNRIRLELNKIDSVGVASYSDEPKGGNAISNPVAAEVNRREKKYKRLDSYLDKMNFIDQRTGNVTNEKHKAALDCMLDGMSMSAIAIHMNISRRTVHHIRDEIVKKLSEPNCTH